jgi:deazaflavin-dependent oxidoreductase (nitroreductase family)
MSVTQHLNRLMGERMAASGRMAMIETTGRRSGRPIRTPVGYVRRPDGSVWVGAGRAEAHWPRNLLATPACRVRIGSVEASFLASELQGDERAQAVTAIRGKYGAPASRVGTGPVFVLRPRHHDASVVAGRDGADHDAGDAAGPRSDEAAA